MERLTRHLNKGIPKDTQKSYLIFARTMIPRNPITILGKEVLISEYMSNATAGASPVAFGNFSYYIIIDRDHTSVKVLREKFAINSQIGYLVVNEVEKSISESDLSKNDIETAAELLADIKLKIKKKKKPLVLKSALVGLKDFLINTGANVAAGIIQAKMQGLF